MNLAQVEWEDPAPASPSSPSLATARETLTIATEDLTIRGRAPRVSTYSPLQSTPKEIREETRNCPTKQHSSGERPPRPRQEDVEAPTPPPQHSPAKKRRRLHSQEATRPEINNLVQTIDTTKEGASSLTGRIEHGQTTQISEDEVLGYKDLLVEAYEFIALLRHDTTYELIEFLARVQVSVAARMAEEYANNKMIQSAHAGELEPEEDRALQKNGCKKQPTAH
mgnify:CR=1 FL=1